MEVTSNWSGAVSAGVQLSRLTGGVEARLRRWRGDLGGGEVVGPTPADTAQAQNHSGPRIQTWNGVSWHGMHKLIEESQ